MTQGVLILTGPSGVGKSTISSALADRLPLAEKVVSFTSRSPRGGERHGEDYWFVTSADFLAVVRKSGFLEYVEYDSAHYGTPRAAVDDVLRRGGLAVLELEDRGALAVKRHYPEALVTRLIAPSVEVLRARLLRRGDAPGAVRRRLALAEQDQLRAGTPHDLMVVNDRLNATVEELLRAVRARRRA